MTPRRVDHSYVKDHLLPEAARLELRWLPLKDRIISCELVIRYLTDRTVDPLTRNILACLPERDDQAIDITQVARAVHVFPNEVGVRVVASILFVLRQANYVRATGKPPQGFWRIGTVDELVGRATTESWYRDLLMPQIHFVPRSQQVSKWIPGTSKEDLSRFFYPDCWAPDQWWQSPDEGALYTDTQLSKAIIAASRANLDLFQINADSQDSAYPRIEVLQRSKLMFATMQPHSILGVTLKKEKKRLYVVHRCYLSCSGSGPKEQWNVHIFRLGTNQGEPAYTQYMRNLIDQHPKTIQYLIAKSKPIT
jgi:hypothetical protein